MREIKFRAWSPILKEMSKSYSVGDMTDRDFGWFPDQADGTIDPGDCVYLQFTGLKDKNGKEIYEGDVLDTIEGGGCVFPNRMIVEYHALAFMFVGITKQNRPSLSEYTLDTITNKEINQTKDFEVIGNIYEHSELIPK